MKLKSAITSKIILGLEFCRSIQLTENAIQFISIFNYRYDVLIANKYTLKDRKIRQTHWTSPILRLPCSYKKHWTPFCFSIVDSKAGAVWTTNTSSWCHILHLTAKAWFLWSKLQSFIWEWAVKTMWGNSLCRNLRNSNIFFWPWTEISTASTPTKNYSSGVKN